MQECALAIIKPANTPQQKASSLPREVAGAIMDRKTGALLKYQHLIRHPKYKETWKHSYGNEIGWLAQGMPGRIKETNTILFIKKSEAPQNRNRDVKYGALSVTIERGKLSQVKRLTIGGDRINYSKHCGMSTAVILTIKLLLNSVISTPNAKFMTMVINIFILIPHSKDINISHSS